MPDGAYKSIAEAIGRGKDTTVFDIEYIETTQCVMNDEDVFGDDENPSTLRSSRPKRRKAKMTLSSFFVNVCNKGESDAEKLKEKVTDRCPNRFPFIVDVERADNVTFYNCKMSVVSQLMILDAREVVLSCE